MADDKHYVPGDFYRICDRTGFKVRAKRTRKEWTGLIIRDQSWERRHPQDFVKGIRDDQAVPEPRPRQTDVFVTASGPALFLTDTASQDGELSWRFISSNGVMNFYVYRTYSVDPSTYPKSS